MLDFKTLEEYILSIEGAKLDYPFGPDVAVYKVGQKMFALIDEHKRPLRISLKCDPALSLLLQDKYEEVMPGYHLNKKHWITIVNSGQLSEDEIKDLISHSYQLVSSSKIL